MLLINALCHVPSANESCGGVCNTLLAWLRERIGPQTPSAREPAALFRAERVLQHRHFALSCSFSLSRVLYFVNTSAKL